jgi:hypothetical protein
MQSYIFVQFFLSIFRYKWAHYCIENGLIMNNIIKVFLITFSFCYIGNISRLTSGVKVTSSAMKYNYLVNVTLHFCEKCVANPRESP